MHRRKINDAHLSEFEGSSFQSVSYFEVDEMIKRFRFSSSLQERRKDN